jgi:Uma2 family endonuclease
MSYLQTKLPTDTWVATSWEGYLQAIADPAYATARGYYYNGHMRIEMLPVGHDHAAADSAIALAINLFGIAKNIALKSLSNCTYRKANYQECQPDISYYIGPQAQAIPWGTSIVDLDRYPAPDLVIEVSSTTLLADQGAKRLLYEDLAVKEYWIVDVQQGQILAFSMLPPDPQSGVVELGSRRIRESQVLPSLSLAVLEEVLQRSRQMDQSQVGAWLLAQFQQ